jgi:hypothetical protein
MIQTFRDLYDLILAAEKDKEGFAAIHHPRLKLKVQPDKFLGECGKAFCILDGKVVLNIIFRHTHPCVAGHHRIEDRVELNNEDVTKSDYRWSKEFSLDSPLYRLNRCKLPDAGDLLSILKSLWPTEDYEDDGYDGHDEHGEQAIIGSFSLESVALTAYINTEDEYIQPHFHLKNEDQSFQTAIEFLRPVYLPHHGQRRDRLTPKQVNWLIGLLKTEVGHPRFTGTVWDLACWDWERNNKSVGIPDDFEMPDYMELLGEVPS